ncbi:MAG: Chorismate synthase [Chlamydiae bacterium]|nr:Chorismate synthase [Chlamydiota bacterium]
MLTFLSRNGMASNSFGNLFKITTFGESHGIALGVVIDGCPALLPITEKEIQYELDLRAPGRNTYTTPRKEKDRAEIVSGVFEGKTTGAPITILVYNKDADSSKYEAIKTLLRPGHANYTYLEKYGIFDYRGGGRSSARETVARVAAGAVAKKFLTHYKIYPVAYVKALGGILGEAPTGTHKQISKKIYSSPIFCGDESQAKKMMKAIEKAKEEGDSLGAIIECRVLDLPMGLGDPVYEKLEANLAKAMLTLPATKGIEFGEGFHAANLKGSEHNDLFVKRNNKIKTSTNNSGGTLGGISNGMPLVFRVAFKPTSSIKLPMKTVDIKGKSKTFSLPEGSRHDPCVAIRAVPIIEAMTALVLSDAILMNRCVKI